MKKIFRMALVFALAGATLMYTGCTKDYSEEINGLGSDVATLNSSLQALQQDLNSLKSSVANLETANTAAKAAIDANTADIASLKKSVAANADAIDGLKKEIVEINSAIEAKADAKAVEAAINQLKKDVAAAIDALQKDVNALKKQVGDNADAIAKLQDAQKGIDDAYAALSNELKSLVFVPQLYYAGIEAVEYNVLGGKELDEIVKATGRESLISDEEAPAKFAEGTVIDFTYDPEKLYALGEIAEAEYNLNPSAFDIAEAKDWILDGKDYDYKLVSAVDGLSQLSNAGESAWKPVVAGDVTAEKGIATVPYTIENVLELPSILSDGVVPVMNLTAVLKDKNIASDYEAIIAVANEFKSIAFKATNKWVTVEECECVNATDKELYWNAKDAVENIASVDVTYNAGKKNLKDLLAVHMVKDCYAEGAPEIEVSIAELEEKYGVTFEFSLVDYTLGGNVTSEKAFGRIDGDYFFPCYYDNKLKKSVDCGEGTEEGISAVGRKPIVLVEVKKGDDVLVGQFFKINIVKDPVIEEIPDPIVLPLEPFKALPYICDAQVNKTTWKQFTSDILETLGMDYKDFQQTYAPGVDANNTYILVDGEYVASDKFGTVAYTKDAGTDGINDVFVWTIDKAAATEIQTAGGTASVFKKFVYGKQVLYVQLTSSIAPAAKADFGGNKIKNEWFDDIHVFAIDDAEANTAHMNVYVPTADETEPVIGGNVRIFDRNLNHYFVSYTPAVALDEESKDIYGDILEDEDLVYSFKFSATQPTIKGEDGVSYVLSAKADGTQLWAKAGSVEEMIASIEEDVVTYSNESAIAKKLLNFWGHSEKNEAKILYSNIHVDITYGECAIKAGEADFHLRFIRPLDAEFNAAEISKDGVVDGANVNVASFFKSIVDWNKVDVIIKNEDGTFAPNVVKTIDMFAYYQFTTVKIDISKTKVNNWNMSATDPEADFAYAYDQDDVDGIKTEMKLSVGTVDANDVFTAAENFDPETKIFEYNIEEGTIDEFNQFVINYRNDEARVGEFTMLIPVSFEYAWGTYDAVLTINVGGTN